MNAPWSKASMAFHWGSAVVVGGLAVAGFVMVDLEPGSAGRLLLSRLHTLFGLLLMVATALRLLVRSQGVTPEPLPLPALHRAGISLVHALLYLVLFGLGASGFITGALSAWPNYLKGALAQAPELHALASRELHEALVAALGALVVTHVAGVFIQQVRAGGALQRMVPRLGAPARRSTTTHSG